MSTGADAPPMRVYPTRIDGIAQLARPVLRRAARHAVPPGGNCAVGKAGGLAVPRASYNLTDNIELSLVW